MIAGAERTTISPVLAIPDTTRRESPLVGDLLTWCCQLLEADFAVVCWVDDDGLRLLSATERVGEPPEERLLPPGHPLSCALADVQGTRREARGIGEPVSRGTVDMYGRYIAVPVAIPATAECGALIVLTGEREAGEKAAESLTTFARLIARELSGVQRHRDTGNLRAMVDLASNSLLILDVTGRITFANEANRGLLGYGPEALAGNQAFAFVHPNDLSRVTSHFERVLQSPGVSSPIE